MKSTDSFIFFEDDINLSFKEIYLLYKEDLLLKEVAAIERLSINTGLSLSTIHKIVQ